MFERSAKDPTFATVFCKSASFFGLVVDECFHANGYKGHRIVVVGDMHVGVGGDFWVETGLL